MGGAVCPLFLNGAKLFFHIGLECLCELIGAGSILLATNALQKGNYLVGRFAFNELPDSLQVAAATADEFYAVNFVFAVQIENNLFTASASC